MINHTKITIYTQLYRWMIHIYSICDGEFVKHRNRLATYKDFPIYKKMGNNCWTIPNFETRTLLKKS